MKKTRAEVKAEATAANKAGTTARAPQVPAMPGHAGGPREPKATDGRPAPSSRRARREEGQKKADKNAAMMSNSGTSTNVPAGNPSPAMGQGTAK